MIQSDLQNAIQQAGHLTNGPTNVGWQSNSMISYFRIFCMDKYMFCMQPINLDYYTILISESMKTAEQSK